MNGGYNLHPNLDVDQWAARLSERNAARPNNPELRNPNNRNLDHSNPDHSNPNSRSPNNRSPNNRNPDHHNPAPGNPDHRSPNNRNPDHSNPDHSNPKNRNPDHHNPNRPWRKYLGWTCFCLVLVLALIMLGIHIRILQQESQAQHQESINISVNANNTVLRETDVTDVTECLWILSSASSTNGFPLLLSVNEKHRVVLGELSARTLDRLVEAQAEASRILKGRAQNVNNHLARAAGISTLSEYDTLAFQSDINRAYKQLQEIDSALDSLAKDYYVVRGSYNTVYDTTASALEEAKLTNRTEYLSFSQSWGSSWFFNPYSVPWNKMTKQMDRVCLGFNALELEITRLEQIKGVIYWLKITLQDLATSIHGWQAECIREAQHNCFPKKLREWFQQNFVQNHQMKETWLELLMSVKRGEQMIYLDISAEWCNGSRQASLSINSG